MKIAFVLIISLLVLTANLNSQDFKKLDGYKIAKIVNAEYVLIGERELILREIERIVELPANSLIDVMVSNFDEVYYVQLFYENMRTSISADKLGDDITICQRVTCSTIACATSASDCQPKYYQDCTACNVNADDCRKQVHGVNSDSNIQKK